MLMTAMVFTFVLLLVNVLREILPMLVNRQVPLSLVAEAFMLLIPFVWVFALPMGMLTATLLVFGRFSADQELTAARAGGLSLVSLVSPVLLLGLALCAISLPVNLEIAPRCRVAYIALREKAKSIAIERFKFPEGQYVRDFSGYIFYVERNRDRELENVRIYQWVNETNLQTVIHARRGRIEPDPANKRILLHLFDIQTEYTAANLTIPATEATIPFDLSGISKGGPKPISTSDMTFTQLRNELKRIERSANAPLPSGTMSPEELQIKRRQLQSQLAELAEPVRVHLHRQVAFSFACFGFTLIGIPLGIRVHRRETNIGIAIALGLVLLYYSLIIVGEAFNTRAEFAPHLLMWAPNLLFQAVGAALLWRANRG